MDEEGSSNWCTCTYEWSCGKNDWRLYDCGKCICSQLYEVVKMFHLSIVYMSPQPQRRWRNLFVSQMGMGHKLILGKTAIYPNWIAKILSIGTWSSRISSTKYYVIKMYAEGKIWRFMCWTLWSSRRWISTLHFSDSSLSRFNRTSYVTLSTVSKQTIT